MLAQKSRESPPFSKYTRYKKWKGSNQTWWVVCLAFLCPALTQHGPGALNCKPAFYVDGLLSSIFALFDTPEEHVIAMPACAMTTTNQDLQESARTTTTTTTTTTTNSNNRLEPSGAAEMLLLTQGEVPVLYPDDPDDSALSLIALQRCPLCSFTAGTSAGGQTLRVPPLVGKTSAAQKQD
eukprot:scaffold184661_cov15-Tisochrysis_lutea.AAC.1